MGLQDLRLDVKCVLSTPALLTDIHQVTLLGLKEIRKCHSTMCLAGEGPENLLRFSRCNKEEFLKLLFYKILDPRTRGHRREEALLEGYMLGKSQNLSQSAKNFFLSAVNTLVHGLSLCLQSRTRHRVWHSFIWHY